MQKVIKNQKVAVLYSPEYGVGWYSWHGIDELLFDPSIVQWLESDEYDKILSYITLKYPKTYFGDIHFLRIEWIPVGVEFRIDEYDGSEVIKYKDDERWITA